MPASSYSAALYHHEVWAAALRIKVLPCTASRNLARRVLGRGLNGLEGYLDHIFGVQEAVLPRLIFQHECPVLVILLIIAEIVRVKILGPSPWRLWHAWQLDQSRFLVIARRRHGLIVWIVLANKESYCVRQLFSERPLLVGQRGRGHGDILQIMREQI